MGSSNYYRCGEMFGRLSFFKLCIIGSAFLHAAVYSGYYITSNDIRISSDDLKTENIEIDFEFKKEEVLPDIPPELIGGESSPAPVEKKEWIEGTGNKNAEFHDDDIDINALSGNGTDKDGYLFSFNGDRPPLPVIDFDLKRFFPAEAKRANISRGTVIMIIRVNADGTLESAAPSSGKAGYGFDEAAMKIVKMIKFRPGYLSGKPVKMTHKLPINFELED